MPLHLAIEKRNPDIVKLLLLQEDLDVNIKSIYIFNIFDKISS